MLAAIVALAMVLPATEKNEELDLLLKRALDIWYLQGRPVLKAGSAEPSHAMMVVAAALDGAQHAAASFENRKTTGLDRRDLSKNKGHWDARVVVVEQEHQTLKLHDVA